MNSGFPLEGMSALPSNRICLLCLRESLDFFELSKSN